MSHSSIAITIIFTFLFQFLPFKAFSYTIVCESEHKRYQRCPAEIRGPVRLVNQLSDAPCIQGRTWGYDRNNIWVDKGCRAEFETGGIERTPHGHAITPDYNDPVAPPLVQQHGYGPARQIKCESNDRGYNYCPADTSGGVRLIRELSKAPCIRWQSWGFDESGIWVDKGCRAVFEIRPRHHGNSEKHRHKDNSDDDAALIAAGVIGGALLLGALTGSENDAPPPTQNDEWRRVEPDSTPPSYSSSQPPTASFNYHVPTGRFSGYSSFYDGEIQLDIKKDGRIAAYLHGYKQDGWFEGSVLHLDEKSYDTYLTQDGFRAVEKENREHRIEFHRQ